MVMALADKANQYIDEQKPWILAKDPATLAQAQAVCTQGINLYRCLITYLSPVVPRLARDSEELLKTALHWDALSAPLLGVTISNFKHLLQRVDKDKVLAMVEASKPKSESGEPPPAAAKAEKKQDKTPAPAPAKQEKPAQEGALAAKLRRWFDS